jgi:hypothetical protein
MSKHLDFCKARLRYWAKLSFVYITEWEMKTAVIYGFMALKLLQFSIPIPLVFQNVKIIKYLFIFRLFQRKRIQY